MSTTNQGALIPQSLGVGQMPSDCDHAHSVVTSLGDFFSLLMMKGEPLSFDDGLHRCLLVYSLMPKGYPQLCHHGDDLLHGDDPLHYRFSLCPHSPTFVRCVTPPNFLYVHVNLPKHESLVVVALDSQRLHKRDFSSFFVVYLAVADAAAAGSWPHPHRTRCTHLRCVVLMI